MTPLEAAYAAYTPGFAAFLAVVDFAGRNQVSEPRPDASLSSPTAPRSGRERGRTRRGGRLVRTTAGGRDRVSAVIQEVPSRINVHLYTNRGGTH